MTKSPDRLLTPAHYHWRWHPFPAQKPPMDKQIAVLVETNYFGLVPVIYSRMKMPDILESGYVRFWMELPEIPEWK